VNGVGEPIRDETYLLLLNPHTEAIQFFMPQAEGTAWQVEIDSANPGREDKPVIRAGEPYELIARSTAIMRELTD
jgi:glycogen operon protein